MKLEVGRLVSDPVGAQAVAAEVTREALALVGARLTAAMVGDARLAVDALDVVLPVPPEELRTAQDRTRAARLLAHNLLQALELKLGQKLLGKVDLGTPGKLKEQAQRLTPGTVEAYRFLERILLRDVDARASEEVLGVVHHLDTAKKEYRLRQRCMQSNWKINTPKAYTDAALPSDKASMKRYIKQPESWCPRRAEIHERIVRQELQKADAVAKRMLGASGGKPTVLMMRGNSGSGKTYTLQNSDHTAIRGLSVTRPGDKGDPKGLLNPDDIKYLLSATYEDGKATSSQVHPEGSMLTERMIDTLFAQKKSMVLDKRFGLAKEVADEVCQTARANGYRIVMIDLDASLDTSCKRVAKRQLKGKAPNVEFKAVAHGFQEIRGDRAKVMDLCNQGQIDAYFLFKSDGPKAGTLIAEKLPDGTFKVYDEALWQDAITAGEAEIIGAHEKWGTYMDVKATGVNPEESGIALPD